MLTSYVGKINREVEAKNEVAENCKKIKFELTSLQRSWIVSFFPDHILPIVF